MPAAAGTPGHDVDLDTATSGVRWPAWAREERVFATASEDQAVAILGAARTVVDEVARTDDPRSGRGRALLVAAGGLLVRPPLTVDVDDLPRTDPETLARVLAGDRGLAEHAAALIAVASLADGRSDPDRLRVVVQYAHHLGVHEGWVRDLLEVARGHLAWAMGDMARRNVATFPGLAHPDDTLPDLVGYRDQTDEDRRLADRFHALESLPSNTYGHAFWAHFRRHGFAFPGEEGAFLAAFAVPHDGLHVLAGYSTSLQGELLVSTFTGAMHHRDALRAHLLPVIFEWHVGTEVNGIGAQQGALDPAKFLVAWDRGESMTADLLAPGWDFWADAERDLEELRSAYGVVPLAAEDAADGPEITVPDRADPDAR